MHPQLFEREKGKAKTNGILAVVFATVSIICFFMPVIYTWVVKYPYMGDTLEDIAVYSWFFGYVFLLPLDILFTVQLYVKSKLLKRYGYDGFKWRWIPFSETIFAGFSPVFILTYAFLSVMAGLMV